MTKMDQDPTPNLCVEDEPVALRMRFRDVRVAADGLEGLELEITESVVMSDVDSANDTAIVWAIIALAHSMNLTVMTEGIETAEPMAILLRRGCEAGQGYLFSPPIPLERAEAFLPRKKPASDPGAVQPAGPGAGLARQPWKGSKCQRPFMDKTPLNVINTLRSKK